MLLLGLLLPIAQLPSTRHELPPRDAGALAQERTPFVENVGQWDHPARYVARFGTTVAMLEPEGLRLGLEGHAIRLEFVGACASTPLAEERLAGTHAYLLGSERGRWREDVPLHGRVRYSELWPGIDLLCHARDGYLEYDLELAPGARLDLARFEVAGAEGLQLEADGTLVIETTSGAVRQPRPATWVVTPAGERRPVEARYELFGALGFGFVVDGWDGSEPLVVDPGLLYGSYYGSSVFTNIRAVALDADGVITLAGSCLSSDLPTTVGALDTSYGGNTDGFVARLDPTRLGGQQLVYATFLGGSGFDDAEDVVVTADGRVVVTGATASSDFPTTPGAFDSTVGGSLDGYVAVLDPSRPTGQQLLYSTLIGGSGEELIANVMVDANERLTLAGWSSSMDFPISLNAFDGQNDINGGDAVVVRLDPALVGTQQLVYGTYLGGTHDDACLAAALGADGSVYLTGYTESNDFVVTANAFDSTYNSPFMMDTFVTRLNPALSGLQQLVYSTYLGSSADDLAYALALDGEVAIVAGVTMAEDYPLAGPAFDQSFEDVEAFVTRLDASLPPDSQLTYSGFFGGEAFDFASAVAVDAAGIITLAGVTYSPDFYVPPGAYKQATGSGEGFLLRFDPNFVGPRQLVYATIVGGDTGFQDLTDLAVDADGFATVVGLTSASDFPVTPGAFDGTTGHVRHHPSYYGMPPSGFVARFDMLPTGVTQYGDSSPGCDGALTIGVSSLPKIGNTRFSLTCTNAPPASAGAVGIGLRRLSTPFLYQGARLWIDPNGPLVLRTGTSNSLGFCDVPWAVPNVASLAGLRVHAQFLWNGPTTPPSCPPLGVSASPALEIRFQP